MSSVPLAQRPRLLRRFENLLPLALLLGAFSVVACAKGQADDPAQDPDSALHDSALHDGALPDSALPADGSRPEWPARDMEKADQRPDPDVVTPDVLSPDVLSPDTLSPDVLSPDTMPQGTFTAPFTLDFEAHGGGLTATKDWEWGTLAFSAGSGCSSSSAGPTQAHSGSKCWGTVLNDCHNGLDNAQAACANADTTDDSVLSIDVAIPSGWTTATLSYWQWFDVFVGYDWGEIRINGTVASQFCKSTPTPPGSSGSWEKVSIDLSSHTGKTVTIAFHFMATNVVNQAGWYIDDLAVSGL